MTGGITTIGKRNRGYYRSRNWSGNDWPIPGEHTYAYHVEESNYPAIQYKPYIGYKYWFDDYMSLLSPDLPQLGVDHTVNLINCAANKCWADIAQSNFNAGVFGGEFKETYVMMCTTVTSIARAISSAKKGNWSKAFKLLSLSPKSSYTGVAANSYMMVHFGILPLLNDIKSGYEFLLTKYKVLKRVRRHCVWKDSKSITCRNGPTTWQWKAKAIVEIRGQVEMVELSPMDRLGLNDLPSVAWELTKLSWMLDWLLPVGNFLSAVNAHNRTKAGSFWLTRMQKEELSHPRIQMGGLPVKNFDEGSFHIFFNPGPLNSRAPYTGIPYALPTIENPLGDNLSRWTTAFAFLRQSVGR